VEAWALALAALVAAVAIAQWAMPSLLNLDRGMFGGDSTWYHLPFSIHFAQTHSTWGLLYTDPLKLTAWFYPASSELLGSVGIVLFHDDWLYPLLNLGWLAVGLLAGYCLGRPRGVGPACAVAAAIALDSGVLILTQAGEARNDEMGIALLLAFAARRPIYGADKIARFFGIQRKDTTPTDPTFQLVTVNGDPGVRIDSASQGFVNVTAVEIVDGAVQAVRLFVNPERFGGVRARRR